ncbi:hypothetical protein [Stratiformator vulcanicus]|uniref:Uncharacterized protein n=1 Tax=Stratiformator vulcanicus TaxID=2527980 RepID=A0A517QXB7_9PLAN|nr:hypothetical protein [Stratiformator vulcanicus]QDT36228.1 hypothetical protein Pan189_05830 [Stratiformator vulcanicus]
MAISTLTGVSKVHDLTTELSAAGIHFTLRHSEENVVSIDCAVPGQRWEIGIHADGRVEVEIFKSDGELHDEETLKSLINEFRD